MHIAHVVPTYLPATRYGGPIASVHGLSRALVERGHRVQVFTTNVDGPKESPVATNAPHYLDGVEVHYAPTCPVSWLRRIYFAPQLRRVFYRHVKTIDVVHLHSVFLWPTSAAARIAEQHHTPYLVAPRGMLDKTLFKARGNLRKRLWIALWERRTLRRASCIHTTSALETAKLVELGLDLAPVCVVANGTDLPVMTGAKRNPNQVLFLGRLTPKKGLDQLIPAMIGLPHAILTIAGPDEMGYRATLEALAAACGVVERIQFTGMVDAIERDKLLRQTSVLVLPSRSENFANVVLEAMAAGCPVVVSAQVGLANVVDRTGAGLSAATNPQAITCALGTILADPKRGARMGMAGRDLVARQFTWNVVAEQMETAYANAIECGHRT